ncbi:32651_t:CDS:2, partial [Gigaspora margarita]
MTTKAEIDPETIPSTKPELGQFIEETVNVANNALSPIVPMLGVVISLINEFMKMLNLIKTCPDQPHDLQHQESFVKFQTILRKIKMFVEKVTRLRAFKTFLFATNIKKEFIELMK